LAVLGSIELIVGEDPLNQLQSGAAAVDECGNLGRQKSRIILRVYLIKLTNSVGMDECDTATVMFDCAKNKEPAMISSMIMNAELNFTAVEQINQTKLIIIHCNINYRRTVLFRKIWAYA
jgi:hypothetical protein